MTPWEKSWVVINLVIYEAGHQQPFFRNPAVQEVIFYTGCFQIMLQTLEYCLTSYNYGCASYSLSVSMYVFQQDSRRVQSTCVVMTLNNFSWDRSLLVFAVDVFPATQWDLQFWGLKNTFLDVKLIFLSFDVNVTL